MTVNTIPAIDILLDLLIERMPDDEIYITSAALEAAARTNDWETVQTMTQDIMADDLSCSDIA